ncbi:hypothetical protein CBR_g49597 [Chara braunii]|uniref:Uncharacterized protein n=1 Tax=Chara braunii TaxID=69332 RepID=A0A388M5F7_CHABU|nr:hypothetical protein CBR_g49597 [Chara braunii]|eukprot:GBG89745.1 hypothetical protein CBR_g49597 [Chara braunii]
MSKAMSNVVDDDACKKTVMTANGAEAMVLKALGWAQSTRRAVVIYGRQPCRRETVTSINDDDEDGAEVILHGQRNPAMATSTHTMAMATTMVPPKEFFPGGWWDELTSKYNWLKEQPWPSKPAQALIATLKPEILDAMKRLVGTRDFPNFFCMIGFSDIANLIRGQASETPTVGCTITGTLALDDEEMAEMNAAIAARTATASHNPEKASSSQERQYTAFAPLPSLHWVEHTGSGFKQALWKLDTFNHLAPFSVKALIFLANLTEEEVVTCKANTMTGALPYCPPGKKAFNPTLLTFPLLSALDHTKCEYTSLMMWHKKLKTAPEIDLKGLENSWNVGRPYLRCSEGGSMIVLPSGRSAWSREGKEQDQFVHIRYTSRLMEAVPLRRMVLEALRQVKGDRSADWLEDVIIGWRYDEPLGAKICKPAKVFRKFRLNEWEAEYISDYCQCGAGRHAEFLSAASIRLLPEERTMHVITNDTEVTNNGQLQLMLNAGLNHIPLRALDEEFTIDEVELALEKILTTRRCDEELSMKEERCVKGIVLKNARRCIRNYRTKNMHITGEPINNVAVRSELEWLTSRYLICPTDKAPHTPTFVCINFIRRLALHRLSEPDLTLLLEEPAQVVARLLQEAATTIHVGHELLPLPHLMTVYQAHKQTFRWITNTAGMVLSPVAGVCDSMMKLLTEDVQALCASKSEEICMEHGIRPNFWWPISSIGEFVANIPRYVYSVFTGDITRYFETIPTDGSSDGLLEAIKFFVRCAMEWKRARTTRDVIAIRIAANGTPHPYWVDGDQDRDRDRLYFDEQGIIDTCDWLISNSIVQMGDKVWRQILRIPMGLAYSPIFCDVYFFKYECELISYLVEMQDWVTVKCFEETYRYIDDLCSLNNTIIVRIFENGIHGQNPNRRIYPYEFIEVKETTEVIIDGHGRAANFLNLSLTITSTQSGTYCTSKHDKKRGLSFSPVRFMRFKSNRSIAQSLQILTAQTVMILITCSDEQEAALEIHDLIQTVVSNGFSRRECWKVVDRVFHNRQRYQPGRMIDDMVKAHLITRFGMY